jgi:PKD repeat protein
MKTLTFTLFLLVFSTAVFATQEKKTLKLRIQSPTGNTDETTLYFDEGIVPAYSVNEDAKYVFNNIPGIPEIYSYTLDKVACSINGCGTLAASTIVDLDYHVGYNGNYTISATLLSNFNPSSIIRLVDNKLNDTIDLRENFYQVQLDTDDISTNRFQILVSSAVQYSSTPSNCTNTGGTITVKPENTIVWNECQLLDSAGNVLQTVYNLDSAVTFTGLAEGNYQVTYTYSQYSATNDFYLPGNFVVANVGKPSDPIYTYSDVVFNAITTNATSYNWDFGDGTLIVGVAHPTQTYYVPGTYVVNFTAANSQGCSATAQAVVVVLEGYPASIAQQTKKDATVTTDAKVITVNMNDAQITSGALITVYNLLGQVVRQVAVANQISTLDLQNEANGYYLVSIRNAGNVTTRRVFIAK